jgi:hypothetical protein
MSTPTERKPFIAPVVDLAAQFIEKRGAVTVSELAEYLSAAGVNVSGDAELTGEELAYFLRRKQFLELPVIASGSAEFVGTVAALLVNRGGIDLDATNSAQLELSWDDGRRSGMRPKTHPTRCKGPHTSGHYHVLQVRDPGGPQQVAECWEDEMSLSHAQQYLDELVVRNAGVDCGIAVDEGWDGIWIVGCGPNRCRRDEICNLPVEEWGEPHWSGEALLSGA